MTFGKYAAVAVFAVFCTLPPLASAGVTAIKEETPGLLKFAKITPEAAAATALARVPQGKIVAAEIEKEDGKLIYSFEIKMADRTGEEEVNVDAITGTVIGVEHEGAADEAREAVGEKP